MPHGLPDYFNASLPGKSIYGTGQTQWGEYGSAVIDEEGSSDLIDYTVPENTLLIITTGFLSCSFPTRVRVQIIVDAAEVHNLYFSEYAILPFSEQGIYELTEGQNVVVRVYNYADREGQLYTINLLGYEITETQ